MDMYFDMFDDMWEVHEKQDGRNDDEEAPKMIAPHLFKDIERIGFARSHKEHKVRIEKQVDDVDGERQTEQKQKAFRQILSTGTDILTKRKHDRICSKEDMHGKAMDMHEIEKRQFCPRRKEKRHDRRGDTDGIKKIIECFHRSEHVNGDKNDIDAAKMERQIAYAVIAKGGKSCDLDELIQNEKPCVYKADFSSFFGCSIFIKITAEPCKKNERQKPHEMQGVKM